ncbi:MAG: hypothetical protein Tsb002_20260 [Wenzhouxiangellaceae bacterium]
MLIAFNKPYAVLSQFRANDQRPTLANYIDIPGVYPAGRLDYDSEGLMLLTDDGPLQHRISAPGSKWAKTYLAQVEGVPTARAIERLRRGVQLKDGMTSPAEVEVLARAPGWLWPRQPPIRQRRHIPTTWLRLTLKEGRNRQVRRMTAAVACPTLRLIRQSIGWVSVESLKPGEWLELQQR